MEPDSCQRRPHSQVQRTKRGAASVARVRGEAGDSIRLRHFRALRGDPMELPNQHPL